MHRPLARRARFVTGIVALTLGLVSSATCLAGSLDAPKPRHACCAAMADGCRSAATVTEDCCATAPGLTGLAPVTPFTLAAPVTTSTLLVTPPTLISQLMSPAFADASTPISPPPYLLDSVFRI
jgi:hypothetical protein